MKKIICALVCIALLGGAVFLTVKHISGESDASENISKPPVNDSVALDDGIVEQKVDDYFAEVQYRVEESHKDPESFVVDGMPLWFHGNPYSYTKDNDKYDALVALGFEAVESLGKLQTNNEKYSSLERYLLAIVIEDITKIDLKASTAYFWEDADTFADSWSRFCAEAADNIKSILKDSSLNKEEKVKELCFFGELTPDVLISMELSEYSRKAKDAANEAIDKINTLTKDELIVYSQPMN